MPEAFEVAVLWASHPGPSRLCLGCLLSFLSQIQAMRREPGWASPEAAKGVMQMPFLCFCSFRQTPSGCLARPPSLWDSECKEQFFLSPEHVGMRPFLQPVLPVPHLALRTHGHTAELTLFCGRGNLRFSSGCRSPFISNPGRAHF